MDTASNGLNSAKDNFYHGLIQTYKLIQEISLK